MTDKFKLLETIRQGTKNVRAAQLQKLMTQFGFNNKKTKHGLLYRHSKYPLITATANAHKESGQERKVYQCYVKNCLKAIDELLLSEAKDEK